MTCKKIAAFVAAVFLLIGNAIPVHALEGEFALKKVWYRDTASCKADGFKNNTITVKPGSTVYFDVNEFLEGLRTENEGTPYYLAELPYVFSEDEEEAPYTDYLPLSAGSYLTDRSFFQVSTQRIANTQAVSKISLLKNSTAADGIHRNLVAVSLADSAKGSTNLRLGFRAVKTIYTDRNGEDILCDAGDTFYTTIVIRIQREGNPRTR